MVHDVFVLKIDANKMLGLNGNLLFDQEGDAGLLIEMVAGGYFFVKASSKLVIKNFF